MTRILGLPSAFPGFEWKTRSTSITARENRVDNRGQERKKDSKTDQVSPWGYHLVHTMICAVIALAAVVIFSAGYQARAVEHAQACFIAAAAMGIGTYVAHRVQPVSSGVWSVLAVGPVALLGYLWTMFSQINVAQPLPVLSSPFLTMLPIQLVAAGAMGSIFTLWYFGGNQPEHKAGT